MRPHRVLLPVAAALLIAATASAACAGSGAPGAEPIPGVAATTATTTAATSTTTARTTATTATTTAARKASTTGHSAAASTSATNWPGYHGGASHHGYSTSMPAAGPLKVVKRLSLDGAVYGSPIAVGGTIIAATENDSVYAFNTSGKLKWKRHLGSPSPASQRPCGDIDPLGITGSPVYSAPNHAVYVVAETGSGGVKHTLWSLNAATGHTRWHKSMDLSGRDPKAMQQRGALAIAGNRVWVTFGGLAGDCGNYVGRLIGVPANGKGSMVHYSVPSAREAGMWQPSGPVVDAHGHLLAAVGNGAAEAGDRYDHSDSVLQFSTSAKLEGYFAPSQWAADNAGDVDLGSVGPAVVGRTWLVQGGKSDRVYVLRQGALHGIGGQVSVTNICKVFGGTAVVGSTVYLPCTTGMRAVTVTNTGKLRQLWTVSSGADGSPVVGGGRVWLLNPSQGILYGASRTTGKVLEKASVGVTSRFATPAIYGRLLLVPTLKGLTIVRSGG